MDRLIQADQPEHSLSIRHILDSMRSIISSNRFHTGCLVIIILFGLTLRLAMSLNDLWLDEAWSIQLTSHIHSSWEVFYGISHDNNHFLNSLWLYWLGPDRSAWAYRFPAVVLGVISIISAYRIGAHQNEASAVIAAMLIAIAVPFVTYGSEARGYAGLIAACLVSMEVCEQALYLPPRSPISPVTSWLLGLAIGFGELSHLTMITMIVGLACSSFLHFLRLDTVTAAFVRVLKLFYPSVICLLPAAVAIIAGYAYRHGMTIGNVSPATFTSFIAGYGRLIRFSIGLPGFISPALSILVGAILIIIYIFTKGGSRFRRDLAIILCLIFPALLFAFKVPNLEFPRYYLPAGLLIVIALSDVLGRSIMSGSVTTCTLSVAVLVILVAYVGIADRTALRYGRGDYGGAVALMTDRDNKVSYTTDTPAWINPIIAIQAARRGVQLRYVKLSNACNSLPNWYVHIPEPSELSVRVPKLSLHECAATFNFQRLVLTGPIPGVPWALYKRE